MKCSVASTNFYSKATPAICSHVMQIHQNTVKAVFLVFPSGATTAIDPPPFCQYIYYPSS